jgi:ATPase subunit of ABC transporter with duplicated ATPase domains
VNAETGKKEKIVQEMQASICRNGVHMYPSGQNFTTAHGNSLAAKYKAENHPIYQEWKASYVAAEVPEKDEPAVVRVSAAAASAEKQAKEAALAEKRAKAAEAKAAREEAAKVKAAEKLKKAQDALEKAQKLAEEAAQPKAKVVGRVKSASPSKPEAAAAGKVEIPSVAAVASPVKAAIKAPTTVKLAPKKKVEEAEIPFKLADDADAGNWIFKGKAVIRTRANLMYVDLGDKEEDPVGEFMGVYDPVTKTLDDSMTEEEAQELADA